MAVSKRLRYEVLRRDNHTCRYCGASAPDVPLRVDHVTPVALGGSDKPDNLATSCEPCNSGKSSATVDSAIVADVADDALRWAAAMERAADNLLEQEKPKLEYRAAFLKEWNRWGYGEGDKRKTIELPGDWKPSIERFRIASLPAWVWADIVDTAMGYEKVLNPNKFKYCCGIAWNKVTAMQEEARRIVGSAATGATAGDPVVDALVAVAIAAWVDVTGEEPNQAQRHELTETVVASTTEGHDLERIVEAARHAAYYGHSSIPVGLDSIDHDRKFEAHQLWANAWTVTQGSYPDQDASLEFWGHCDRLYEVGARVSELKTAAVVAAYHLSTVPHHGVDRDHLNAAGINAKKQHALDVWASSFVGSAARWPTPYERRKFEAQLERLTDDGGFLIFDANAAAVAAGAAQEADLYWNVPRQLSALHAASKPMAGEGN